MYIPRSVDSSLYIHVHVYVHVHVHIDVCICWEGQHSLNIYTMSCICREGGETQTNVTHRALPVSERGPQFWEHLHPHVVA